MAAQASERDDPVTYLVAAATTADRCYLSAEWIVAGVAVLTLLILAYQANEMRKATQAMRDNTKVLLESQRPMIAAQAHGDPTQHLADRAAPRVQIELVNRGLSPAYDFVYETWIELLEFPFKDFTLSAEHHKSTEQTVLYPNHGPLIINIPITKGLTLQQLSDLRALRQYACVRVRVQYRDASSPHRRANFGFSVTREGPTHLPKYNDAG